MLISVIVPVYNVEKYLRECLDSILNQTYKELEIILVDDGSKDTSGKICDEYAAEYSNFRVIHKKNAGLGMARNTGLEHIRGEYVTFVDSDDYLDPSCIEQLYNNLKSSNVDMCKGGFWRVLDSGKKVLRRQYSREVYKESDVKKNFLPKLIGSSSSEHDSIEMCVCGAIYKVEIIRKYGLKFPSERELISEDLIFNIDYMQYSKGVCTIKDTGYNYRMNRGSLTTSYREDRFEASKYFYNFVKDKLEKLKYGKDTIQRLQKTFFIYIRMCLAQECKRVSGHNELECLSRIDEICNDVLVQNIIEIYPKKKLGIKQNIFLLLIKNKNRHLLFYLAEMRVM